MSTDYRGQPYDQSEFDLVEGRWDHEHCGICWFTITDGFTYWENADRIKLLCDACHEALVNAPPILDSIQDTDFE